jgi:hypothetical protein
LVIELTLLTFGLRRGLLVLQGGCLKKQKAKKNLFGLGLFVVMKRLVINKRIKKIMLKGKNNLRSG